MELVHKNGPFSAYSIDDYDEIFEVSDGTDWCTGDEEYKETVEDYLHMGNFIIIFNKK